MTTKRPGVGKWRSLSGGAATAVLILMLVASACTDSSTDSSVVPTDEAATVATSAAAAATTSGSESETAAIEDPGRLLADAIAAVGTRYQFDTSVELTGGTLTLVSGRIYDDASAYLITTVGSELEYVITAESRWVREPGDNWVTLQEAAPVSDPLSVLVSPVAIEVLAANDSTVTLAATYLGETLGFPDTEQVTIELVITGARLTSLRYEAAAGQDVAVVETEISTTVDVEPVTAPIPAG